MTPKRRNLWLAATVTILLTVLAACLLLDSQPFDPHQVTAAIQGDETNGSPAVILVISNNSRSTIYHDGEGGIFIHYAGLAGNLFTTSAGPSRSYPKRELQPAHPNRP